MLKLGPPLQFSCERFEGKHKDSKDYSKVTTSRLNPTYSLLLKNQLRLCYRFMSKKCFEVRLSFGDTSDCDLSLVEDYSFEDIIPKNIGKKFCISWIRINGTFYGINMVISVGTNNNITLFGKIRYIIATYSQEVSFLYNELNTLSFCNNFHAFEVAETTRWRCISQTNLTHVIPCSTHSIANGKTYVPCSK